MHRRGRRLLSAHRRGRGWWCAQAHRITRRWLLSTHRRERQWNNESKVTIRAPAWTRVVVCAGTPNNASMVTVYAPAGTIVVVCAGTPHTTLRVTIHAPAWTKVVVCTRWHAGASDKHAPAYVCHSTSNPHWCPTPHEAILGVRYPSCPCVLERTRRVCVGRFTCM